MENINFFPVIISNVKILVWRKMYGHFVQKTNIHVKNLINFFSYAALWTGPVCMRPGAKLYKTATLIGLVWFKKISIWCDPLKMILIRHTDLFKMFLLLKIALWSNHCKKITFVNKDLNFIVLAQYRRK